MMRERDRSQTCSVIGKVSAVTSEVLPDARLGGNPDAHRSECRRMDDSD